MGQLVWTCGNGADLQAESLDLQLIAGRSPTGGYRYAVMIRASDDPAEPPLATGSRESLREAIEAAEHALATFETARQNPT